MISGRKLLSRLGWGSWSQEGVPAGSTRFLSFGCGLPPNPDRHPWKHVRGSEFCVRFSEIYLASTRRRPSFDGHARSQTVGMGQAAIKCRGVQYLHWVMHKCIMVKVGGEIHVKYVKTGEFA